MAEDISLLIVIVPADHDLSYDSYKQARRYRRGDTCEVMAPSRVGQANRESRLGYIHMLNVPTPNINSTKTTLLDTIIDPLDPLGERVLRRRKWRVVISNMPTLFKDELLASHELTVTWGQVKLFLMKKIVTETLNPLLDDESISITDVDVGVA